MGSKYRKSLLVFSILSFQIKIEDCTLVSYNLIRLLGDGKKYYVLRGLEQDLAQDLAQRKYSINIGYNSD